MIGGRDGSASAESDGSPFFTLVGDWLITFPKLVLSLAEGEAFGCFGVEEAVGGAGGPPVFTLVGAWLITLPRVVLSFADGGLSGFAGDAGTVTGDVPGILLHTGIGLSEGVPWRW